MVLIVILSVAVLARMTKCLLVRYCVNSFRVQFYNFLAFLEMNKLFFVKSLCTCIFYLHIFLCVLRKNERRQNKFLHSKKEQTEVLPFV